MAAEREPIGVIGTGYVGLVTAVGFAELGHEVHCRDIAVEKIEALRRGEVPIHEPGLPEMLARSAERLHFTTEMAPLLERARLLFCCVDTPSMYSGDADLSRVEQVLAEIGDSEEHALVMKSTVPVGTGRSIARRGDGFAYVSNPEFLKEGTAVRDFLHPDRVVVGAEPRAAEPADRVAALYEPLGAPIVRTDVASAEMIKLASNAFLATKISFINEIANVSEELGADVAEVARGMGLDERIGPDFLRAGIGYGGSCLAGEETVLARRGGRTRLVTLARLFDELGLGVLGGGRVELVRPEGLEVLSWGADGRGARFLPVAAATRRLHEGEIVEVRTETGRRARCTPDHPFVVAGPDGGDPEVKLARELGGADWLPLAGAPWQKQAASDGVAALAARQTSSAEAARAEAPASGPAIGPAAAGPARPRLEPGAAEPAGGAPSGGGSQPSSTVRDERFWRVVGLYLARGSTSADGARRLRWSFRCSEDDLVEEVAGFWRDRGVEASVDRGAVTQVSIASEAGAGWREGRGLDATGDAQRLPDLIWDEPASCQRALVAGMWRGGGSRSDLGGRRRVLEYGPASGELADGLLRLLGALGVVAILRVGWERDSGREAYWARIAGDEQVERLLELVGEGDGQGAGRSPAPPERAPGGYGAGADGTAWVRVVGTERRRFRGPVYSLEVPGTETFVTTGGLVVHNCFPKDVTALKQLAGNSGYHFQLLTAVIEVNELQKRRTIGKLKKHLGSLVGREIALLGLAFKPHTDDVREATSFVLAARLQSEGAHVRAYDPVAGERAAELLRGVRVCGSALEALDGADAAVLVTEWPEFRELDWAGEIRRRMSAPLVVDGRNFLDRDALAAAGFAYEAVGRPAPVAPAVPAA